MEGARREGGEKNGRKARKMDKGVEGRRKGGRKRGKKGMENALSLTFWVFRVYTCSLSIYKISLGALWYCAGPCGIPGQKSLSGASIFWLQKIGFIQTLGPSLSSKEQVQTVANWGWEGDAETELRQEPKKQQCGLGEVLWFPSKAAQDNSFELSCSTRWEKLASQRAQTSWNRKLIMLTPTSVQLLSQVRLFATLWAAARQASLSITNSRSLLKLISYLPTN